jgi:UDP-N-acetylglucosamine 4,6-dehydratase
MSGRSILVTGATGSFGSAFVRHLVTTTDAAVWRRIIVFSRDELKQSEMQRTINDDRLRWFLGDVRDADRVALAFRNVQVVVHAAALKQVPALEYNPTEAIKTNVVGSMHVMLAALETGVERVLALSTDKAVSPVNLYGATKLCMERTLLAANAHAGPKCSIVRYGNVAGSRGSVIPIFRQHIGSGEAVPITHPDMSRFWITIPQAVRFVEHALSGMQGGEVFVPQMPSVRVTALAAALGSVRQRIVGIRPGEKLAEVVVGSHEHVPGLPSPYASDTNDWWLEGEELCRAVEAV